MRTLEFPYTLYKGHYLPIVPVEVYHRDEWFALWAYVDSGATYSIFKVREAVSMGLDLSEGVQRLIVVGDGNFIPAVFLRLPLRIGDVTLEAEIGFSEKLGVDFNLLERKNIFDTFRVCFSDSKNIISFHQDQEIF